MSLITRTTPDGDEVGLALFGPRECPGLFASLEGKKFPAGARCLSDDAEVLRLDRTALLHVVDRDSAVTRALGGVLQHHNAVLREKVEVLTAGEVPQRLATLFHLLAERFGDERESGELSIPL
ncbi:MAG TPA: Crp/Fnr family transcriptional regulator, partial [Plasticicumulans sp.]|nr:Crp/Fnr family transcriptional regulator [Plasticicumulans sp.]